VHGRDHPGLIIAFDLIHREPISIFPWESCRTAAERMAQAGIGRLPVVSPDEPCRVIGILTRSDLLKPRAQLAEEETRRERFIRLRLPFRRRRKKKHLAVAQPLPRVPPAGG
jgi:CBS-domain-containing membrane protein